MLRKKTHILLGLWYLFGLLNIVLGIPWRTVCSDTGDPFQNAHVNLIVSPLISHGSIRELEIYWNHVNYQANDVIGLYTDVPRDDLEPIYRMTPGAASGVMGTGLQAEFVPSSNLTFTKQCLKYHVAWLRDGKVRKTNCLETRPNWMAEMKSILKGLAMRRIFLPGSHDSGSYFMSRDSKSENIVAKYVVTQDLDILGQLMHGVRYLDIRVGYYPDTTEIWWINHGFIRWLPLQKVVNDVKTFLDNTKEIVIFDVQEFPSGFKNQTIHDWLVRYLETEFVKHFLPKRYGWDTPLSTIWQMDRRLIIGYDEQRVVQRHESVWPCVTHQWGNVQTVDDLFTYLNRIETAHNAGTYTHVPRAAMAELTANTMDVILNRLGGLRKMANRVNMNVTNWYNTLWQKSANVVAVDFVRGSGIVETAIEWNQKRYSLVNCLERIQSIQQ